MVDSIPQEYMERYQQMLKLYNEQINAPDWELKK